VSASLARMRLAALRIHGVSPFADLTLSFADEAGVTRPMTVVFGADGTGKTTLLACLACTRPGHGVAPMAVARNGLTEAPWVRAEWVLGSDDPGRPHPLVVASPGTTFESEAAEESAARRREQAMFDRRAQSEGGHVFVAFSGARWFSRTANLLTAPERSILRWDVKNATSFDDPTRADLTRETKQVITYAAVAAALGGGNAEHEHLRRFDCAVREVLDCMLEPLGYGYRGVNPASLEPEFVSPGGRVVAFEALPRSARHLSAIGVISLRALFAAYPGAERPRESEGVVAVDDAESQQDPALQRVMVALFRRALPEVQWIFTTASTQLTLGCNRDEVIALRATHGTVEAFDGLLH
jgi:hypothetical protein